MRMDNRMNTVPAAMAVAQSQIVSLSHPIFPGMPLWPGDPAVSMTTVASQQKDGYFLRAFSMGEHSATHVNAPASFFDSTDTSWMRTRLLPIVVIDVSAYAWHCPDFVFTERDLDHFESRWGKVASGTLVILRSGWFRLWRDQKRFFGLDTAGNMHFPSFSNAVVKRLVIDRRVAGVGVDTHGVDAPWDTDYTNNRLILSHRAIVLECLARLDKLPIKGAWGIVAPLALLSGSGAPAMVSALIPVGGR